MIGWELVAGGVLLGGAALLGLLRSLRAARGEGGAGAYVTSLGCVLVLLLGVGAALYGLNLGGNLGR